MRGLRQAGTALLIALASVGLVIGGLSLSLAEHYSPATPVSATIFSPTPIWVTPTPSLPNILISATVSIDMATPTFQPTQLYLYQTSIQVNTSLACGPPFDWVHTYFVQPGDTLFHIAYDHFTTTSALQQANCLGVNTIIHTGDRLWVPDVSPREPAITVVSDSPIPYPTEPLTETPLPFTLTPNPTDATTPTVPPTPTP
jgi:hypothetical protein